jgi:hypothetical protein
LAAETNTGAAIERALHAGYGGEREPLLPSPRTGHMTLDPAEELDPVLDLGLPADEEGVVIEDWRAALKVSRSVSSYQNRSRKILRC